MHRTYTGRTRAGRGPYAGSRLPRAITRTAARGGLLVNLVARSTTITGKKLTLDNVPISLSILFSSRWNGPAVKCILKLKARYFKPTIWDCALTAQVEALTRHPGWG
jgi:hypothetical protein